MQRLVITLLLTLGALVVLFSLTQLGDREEAPPIAPDAVERQPAAEDEAAGVEDEAAATGVAEAEEPAPAPEAAASYEPIAGLRARAVATQPEPEIGSLEPDEEANPYTLQAKFTPWGGGIISIHLSRYSRNVQEFEPYPLQERQVSDPQRGAYRYPMAADTAYVNGQAIDLLATAWEVVDASETEAVFQTVLVDGDDNEVLRITRTWRLAPDDYSLRLAQRFENLSDAALRVSFTQQGPVEMAREPGYIGDQRHVVIGYGQPQRTQPDRKYPTTDDFYLSRRRILGAEGATIWPGAEGDPERDLLWAALTNRYFAAAVYAAPLEPDAPPRQLEPIFPTVRRDTWGSREEPSLGLLLDSAPFELTPAAVATLRTNLYAGPKSPDILKAEPKYIALQMGELIRYNLGGPCAALTFAWLAEGLLAFLTFIHDLLWDWGIAIILLVAVVRLVLHPLTKKSQVNMMKMSKQMQALQPEIDRIKKKYADDPKKLQQEQLKLFQEKGVNPFAMGLGCLPMFVQMPIWIALYAMLYFAIELRHEPAFWGVFQGISNGSWPFLADLSDQDRFIPLPEFSLFFGLTFASINLLPLLLMVVFYVQQKYMAPPPNPNMSDEQKMQQKMMRYMIMIFPIILYFAPSGLNLYILASTSVGIVESMRVRRHLKELEDQGKLFQPKKRKEGGFFDRLQKAAEQQQKLMEQKQADRNGGGGGGGGKGGRKGKKKKR